MPLEKTNLDSVLKNRDIILLTKIQIVKAMVLPVVMYGCESWTIKEGWVPNNWYFQTVVQEKALESPLDCKEVKPVNLKGDQSWIFIGKTDAEGETPILWPPDVKSWPIGKDPDTGKIGGKRRKEQQRMRWLDSITDSMDMNLSKLQETVEDRRDGYAAIHGVSKSQTHLWDWTTTLCPTPKTYTHSLLLYLQ